MTLTTKGLSQSQMRIWRAARRYASAEMTYENADYYAYRNTGIIDPGDLQAAGNKRRSAAQSLLKAIRLYGVTP